MDQHRSGKVFLQSGAERPGRRKILVTEVEIDPGALGQVAVVMDLPGRDDQKVAPLQVKKTSADKEAAAALLHVEDLVIIMKVIDRHLVVRVPGDPVDIDPVDVQIGRPHMLLPAGPSGSRNKLCIHSIRKIKVCIQINVKTGQKISGLTLCRARYKRNCRGKCVIFTTKKDIYTVRNLPPFIVYCKM